MFLDGNKMIVTYGFTFSSLGDAKSRVGCVRRRREDDSFFCIAISASRFFTLLRVMLFSIFVSAPAFAQSSAPLQSTLENWSVTLPSSQVLGVYNDFSPSGVGCMIGDVNGSGADSLVCVNRSYPNLVSNSPYPGTSNEYAIYYSPSLSGDNSPPSSFLIFQSTKNVTSGFSLQRVVNQSASQEQVKFGGLCALADFAGDGRSDIACFGSQDEYYASSYLTYPTVWFAQGVGGSTLDLFSGPVANTALTFPPPLDLTSGSNITEVPFGPYCTTGHFMAGPGSQILCGIPTWYSTTPTNSYVVYRYTASYNPAESISEAEYRWTGPSRVTPIPPGSDSWAINSYAVNFGGDCLTGDFNGDGLTDIACPSPIANAAPEYSGSWTIGYSTGTGFSDVSWTPNSILSAGSGTPAFGFNIDCATGDFNGDGKTDLICAYDDGTGDGKFAVYLANANGSGFQAGQTWTVPGVPIQVHPILQDDPEGSTGPGPAYHTLSGICAVADLNGDGKSDVICYADNTSDPAEWVYGLSTGSGFQTYTIDSIIPPVASIAIPFQESGVPQSSWTNNTRFEPFASACTLGDFLGNGSVDILCNPEALTGATSSTYTFSLALLSRSN